jgi:hypothetical protein
MTLILPRLSRGRPSPAARDAYDVDLRQFCELITEINSRLEFQVSSRGWCYILEEHGLKKGDFDGAQDLMAECRRQRLLPMDIVAEDGARAFENIEYIDDTSPKEEAEDILNRALRGHHAYWPFSFWDDQDYYVEMLVKKIDLKTLFGPICSKFYIKIANARGWSDMNMRWAKLERIRTHAAAGRHCVILYCGDHDPAGLNISECLRRNLSELLTQAEWLAVMDSVTVDRFGLNADFIAANNLSWIDNLETGSGRSLADPRHKDHNCAYVQNYLRQFGARKVEANALVVRPDARRALCRQAILKYVPEDAPKLYAKALKPHRAEVLRILKRKMKGAGKAEVTG